MARNIRYSLLLFGVSLFSPIVVGQVSVLTPSINSARLQVGNLVSGQRIFTEMRHELLFRRYQMVPSNVNYQKVELKKTEKKVVAKPPSPLKLDWTMMSPVKAKVKHWFGQGEEKLSRGIVFEVVLDQSVYAPLDGKVAFAGDVKDFGYVVMIEKDDQNLVLLSGLGFLKVRQGETVYRGQVIGTVVKGDNLYLEFRNSGVSVDPKKVLVSG